MIWLKAAYHFHTYCYRDPRSVYSSGISVPVVSPTTVFLGIASSLFRLGRNSEAQNFLAHVNNFRLFVDSPDGIIFFRAFHQVRRYETTKMGKNPATKRYDVPNERIGLTAINQATKEYGIVQGEMTLYLEINDDLNESVRIALENLTHLGTRDSICSLKNDVEIVEEPSNIVYYPSTEINNPLHLLVTGNPVTMVTLSRFTRLPQSVIHNWYMAGVRGETELVIYVIAGKFQGTTRGKIFKKQG